MKDKLKKRKKLKRGGRKPKVRQEASSLEESVGYRFPYDGRSWTIEKFIPGAKIEWRPLNVYFSGINAAAFWLANQLAAEECATVSISGLREFAACFKKQFIELRALVGSE